jgi:hypothetical protein
MSRLMLLLIIGLQTACFNGDYIPSAKQYARLRADLAAFDHGEYHSRGAKHSYVDLAELCRVDGIGRVVDDFGNRRVFGPRQSRVSSL